MSNTNGDKRSNLRKPISRSLRFKVFNRDGFSCHYCGKQPPSVVLEVDHILSVSAGGKNNEDNLITACFDCNRGKGANKLNGPAPIDAVKRLEIIRERENQVNELKKAMRRVELREQSEIKILNETFKVFFPGHEMSERFMDCSVRRFIQKLPFNVVHDSLKMACSRIGQPDGALKYFCGICWRIIKENL